MFDQNDSDSINTIGQDGETALTHAAARNKINVVKDLLKCGAKIEGKNRAGHTALVVAAKYGYIDIVSLFLAQTPKPNLENVSNDNATALMFAAQSGHCEVLRILLESGANVNAKGNGGLTALHIATLGNHVNAMKLLLKWGADINAREHHGLTPLLYALCATKFNHIEAVKLLLTPEHHANTEIPETNTGYTPLFVAANRGYFEAVELLIEAEANIDLALLLATNALKWLQSLLNHTSILTYFIDNFVIPHLDEEKDKQAIILSFKKSYPSDIENNFKAFIQHQAPRRIKQKTENQSSLEPLTPFLKELFKQSLNFFELSEEEKVIQRMREGIEAEKNNQPLSLDLSSPTILLAIKRRNRFQSGKVFNGFILKEHSPTESELDQFLTELKTSLTNIPLNTRIQLAVVSKYKHIEHTEKTVEQSHWTAVDILVGENGDIHSFTLDAINGRGFEKIYNALVRHFPEGKHYLYVAVRSFLQNGGGKTVRIQSDLESCITFSIEHLRQLSNINSDDLYQNELPKIIASTVYSDRSILVQNFVAGSALIPLIRSAQSLQLPLRKGVPESVIKNANITLSAYIEKSKKTVDGNVINGSIKLKAEHLKKKKNDHIATLTEDTIERILQYRQGLICLRNPCLFGLANVLAYMSDDDTLYAFINTLNNALHAISINSSEIQQLSSQNNSSKSIKYDVFLSIMHLFNEVETVENEKMRLELTKIIDHLVLNKLKDKLVDLNIKAKKNKIKSNKLMGYEAELKANIEESIRLSRVKTKYVAELEIVEAKILKYSQDFYRVWSFLIKGFIPDPLIRYKMEKDRIIQKIIESDELYRANEIKYTTLQKHICTQNESEFDNEGECDTTGKSVNLHSKISSLQKIQKQLDDEVATTQKQIEDLTHNNENSSTKTISTLDLDYTPNPLGCDFYANYFSA